jgi:CheY-like chemotaxis protein
LELLERDGVQPRFALIDLDLPGMNGLELIRRLERLSPHILAMLITATGRERLERILQNHHLLYFRKPLDFNALLSALAGG